MDLELYISTAEAQKQLGIGKTAMHYAINRGYIEGVKVGGRYLLLASSVDAYAEHRANPERKRRTADKTPRKRHKSLNTPIQLKNPNLGDDRKTELIALRLRPSEHVWLDDRAKDAGVTKSQFIRDLMRREREKAVNVK